MSNTQTLLLIQKSIYMVPMGFDSFIKVCEHAEACALGERRQECNSDVIRRIVRYTSKYVLLTEYIRIVNSLRESCGTTLR